MPSPRDSWGAVEVDDGSVPHNVVGPGWRSPDRISGYSSDTFATPGTDAYPREVVVAP